MSKNRRERAFVLLASEVQRVGAGKMLLPLLLLFPVGCGYPTQTQVFPSPDARLSYRVEFHRGKGAISPSSTAVFAVLQNGEKRDEKLVLSGIDVDFKKISWQTANEGSICLAGGYTETYRRIVALTIGPATQAVYTHLSDSC